MCKMLFSLVPLLILSVFHVTAKNSFLPIVNPDLSSSISSSSSKASSNSLPSFTNLDSFSAHHQKYFDYNSFLTPTDSDKSEKNLNSQASDISKIDSRIIGTNLKVEQIHNGAGNVRKFGKNIFKLI